MLFLIKILTEDFMVRQVSSTTETNTVFSPSSYLTPLKDLIAKTVRSFQKIFSHLTQRPALQPSKPLNIPFFNKIFPQNSLLNNKAERAKLNELIQTVKAEDRRFERINTAILKLVYPKSWS